MANPAPVHATAAHMRNHALRAVDDPAKLAQAARIVRAALQRRVLTPRDLRGDIVKPSDLAGMVGTNGEAAQT